MSLLVVVRLASAPSLTLSRSCLFTDVTQLGAHNALKCWGISDTTSWREAFPRSLGRTWDDALLEREHTGEGRMLLRELAQNATGMAIWYASFCDELPRASSPEGFVAEVERQLDDGEDELACLFLGSASEDSGGGEAADADER